jgi:hypothetical protein
MSRETPQKVVTVESINSDRRFDGFHPDIKKKRIFDLAQLFEGVSIEIRS